MLNRIIGDSHFELLFARFLEDCNDVVSYAKNYLINNAAVLEYGPRTIVNAC